MEDNTQSKNNRILYTLIGVFVLALLVQNIFFSRKLDTLQQKVEASVRHAEPYASNPAKPAGFRQARQNHPASAFQSLMDDSWDQDPFAAMERMNERIFRMMNTARTMAPAVMQQMQQDMASDFSPAVDLQETDTSYIVKCDIPGLQKDKINITTRGDMLTIQGIRESETQRQDAQGYYSFERSYGSFARSLALPGPVDESQIKADYKDGVLTITLPKEKGAESGSKKIAVQ